MSGENFAAQKNHWHTCTFHDDIAFTNDECFLVATSSLTNRYWKGKLSLYTKLTQKGTKPGPFHQAPSHTSFSENSITNVKYLSKHKRAITTHDSGDVSMWQLPGDGAKDILEMKVEVGHDDAVLSLDVNSDQSRFATTSSDCQLKIWSADDCSTQAAYTGHSELVSGTCFHPHSSDLLITCSHDKRMLCWDLRKLKPVVVSSSFTDLIPTVVAYIPSDPTFLMVGSEAGEVVTMDTRSLKAPLARTTPHNLDVNRIQFSSASPDLLATCSDDLTVVVSRLNKDHSITSEYKNSSHSDFVKGVAWSSSCRLLVSCSWDGRVIFHDVSKPLQSSISDSGDN